MYILVLDFMLINIYALGLTLVNDPLVAPFLAGNSLSAADEERQKKLGLTDVSSHSLQNTLSTLKSYSYIFKFTD